MIKQIYCRKFDNKMDIQETCQYCKDVSIYSEDLDQFECEYAILLGEMK